MIDLTNGIQTTRNAVEGFKFNNQHTSDYNMWLVDRSAPTPQEKTIVEDIPFMQGNYDFSDMLGERIFQNRPLTYTFEILNRNYSHRKSIQTSLENWLMQSGFKNLYDDHAENYYYIAKCTSVDVADSYGGLTVSIEFEAYPFKISEHPEGHDIWDIFNFETDYFLPKEFTVSGTTEINVYNAGISGITPTIKASSPMEIVKGGLTYQIPAGTSKSEQFRLLPNDNIVTVNGNGTIEFVYYKELI